MRRGLFLNSTMRMLLLLWMNPNVWKRKNSTSGLMKPRSNSTPTNPSLTRYVIMCV